MLTSLMPMRPWRTDSSGTVVPTNEFTALAVWLASILTGLMDPLTRRPAPTGRAVPASGTALPGNCTGLEASTDGTLLVPGAEALNAGFGRARVSRPRAPAAESEGQ